MRSKVEHFLELAEARSQKNSATLRALNPYGVLERGYAIVQDTNGLIIGKSADVPQTEVEILFSDGKVRVRRTA